MENLPNDFDEHSARKLIETLLEEDVKVYSNFLPEIKKFNRECIYKLINGEEICKKFRVSNRLNFELLVNKFNNFHFLIEQWYTNESKYKYLKELWLEYIALEKLKNLDPEDIEKFLTKQNIDYKTWPDDIKIEFRRCVLNTEKTLIEKLRRIYDNMPDCFKRLIGTGISLGNGFKKAGENSLAIFVFGFTVSAFQEIAQIGSGFGGAISKFFSDLFSKHGSTNFSLKGSIDFIKNNCKQYTDLLKAGFNSKLTLFSYGIATIAKLGYSINTCKELMNSKEVDELRVMFNDIKNYYEKEKQKVDEILKDIKLNNHDLLTLFERLVLCKEMIESLKYQLSFLINKINLCIEENKKKKSQEIFNIIISTLQAGAGAAGTYFADSTLMKIGYGVLTLANVGNIVLNAINIGLLQKNIKSLNELLKEANKLDEDMEKTIKNIKDTLKVDNDNDKDTINTSINTNATDDTVDKDVKEKRKEEEFKRSMPKFYDPF